VHQHLDRGAAMMSADAARIIPERFRGPSGEDRKLSIVIEAFTPHHSNTLFGEPV
jgi:hypothetical protein